MLATLATLPALAAVVGVGAGPAAVASAASAVSPRSATPSASSQHEDYPVPPGGAFTFHGRGYGHGHGMSQWGAYGAAKVDKMSAPEILGFYYPDATLVARSTTHDIRVLVSAADAPDRGYLEVRPAAGLTMTKPSGTATVLPTTASGGGQISAWRLQRHGTHVRLRQKAAGAWSTVAKAGTGATFSDTAGEIDVVEPSGDATYYGTMTGELESGVLEAVGDLPLESYLRTVVPSEMPASWSMAALEAQAVAARTYAARARLNPKASWYDIDGDTRDQAYSGLAAESPRTDKAIARTAGEVLVDSDRQPILAQYGAADGGWTTSGDEPYLPAEHDPYDGAVANTAHAWTASVSASELETAYPSVGTLTSIDITGRDGDGLWGGRVTTLRLVGSAGSVHLSGTDLQFALGLRSPWFRPEPLPAAPQSLSATVSGHAVTVTWKRPDSVRGASAVTGYRLEITPDGSHRHLAATDRTATVRKVARGSETVTLVARSAAGDSPAASVTLTVPPLA